MKRREGGRQGERGGAVRKGGEGRKEGREGGEKHLRR